MNIYKKPIIAAHPKNTGIVPLAAVAAVGAAATTVTEILTGAAAVAGFLTGLGDDDFHPEHARTLTARKDFVFA